MKIYLSLIFLAVILTAPARAEPDQAYSATRVFLVESIPTFDLKDATFEEAVAALEEKWKNQFPKLACPIASIRYEREEGPRGNSTAAITLSLKNVTYREAFGYIAALSGRRVIDIRDLSVAEEIAWIQEDWRTCAIKISKPVLEFFNLSKGMSEDEVTSKIKACGIKFPYKTKVRLSTDGTILAMTNVAEENQKFLGIVHLLNEGYSIKRIDQNESPKP